MFIEPLPAEKFLVIQNALSKPDNLLSVSELCRIANVSRSGYYRWVAAAESRERREAQD